MYMIGHLIYGTLNAGSTVWTLCGQDTLLLPVQLELGRISQSLIVPARDQHIAFNAMQQPDTISEGGWAPKIK